MEKKLIFFAFFVLLACLVNADLVDIYKKGKIELLPVPDFGKNTDWVELFLNGYSGVAIAPDGSIFVSNNRQHCVFKFGPDRSLNGKFGQRGEGPGDFYAPSNLSILDGKYLVVGEYASRRRISLFDLDGKYVKILKTKDSVFKTIALRRATIAYSSHHISCGNSKKQSICSIFVKDIVSGKEILIVSFKLDTRCIRFKTGGAMMFGRNTGDEVLRKTKKGNLLVGLSSTPVLKIYSPDGQLVRTIKLKISPIAVTDQYISKFKQQAINGMKEDLPANEYLFYEKQLKNASFKQLFAEYLPYYKRVMVDSDGNLLVFRWLDCFDEGSETVQVYNADGEFICETQFTGDILNFQETNVDRNMVFTDKGIIGVFRLPDDDDETYRLMKVEYKY